MKGGIVTRAHLGLVGEAGPEAIIPLRRANLGHTINVSAPVTISGSAQGDIVAALRDHAGLIAQEVGRLPEDENMSLAAI